MRCSIDPCHDKDSLKADTGVGVAATMGCGQSKVRCGGKSPVPRMVKRRLYRSSPHHSPPHHTSPSPPHSIITTRPSKGPDNNAITHTATVCTFIALDPPRSKSGLANNLQSTILALDIEEPHGQKVD
ncbi:MAG: hypothetical protein J3Q66DRAFT_372953 [Benniella sp.]|nr:MAG: hypothetical protein J3Q66DRAFT_372953 [Benniella sp.]